MQRFSYFRDRRGSVLGATLIIALAITLILAGLIRWSQAEQRTTVRHLIRAEAQLTAESVAQYGASQIKARLEQITYFPDDEFRPERNAPYLPTPDFLKKDKKPKKNQTIVDGVGTLLDGLLNGESTTSTESETSGSTDTAGSANRYGYFRYEITPDNLVVGRFTPARWERASADDPLFAGDPLVDQMVRLRQVRMVASARATDPGRGPDIMAYCEQYLQVRDSPVWGYVLFYNMDLEIAPGPAMDVYGPVHANGDLYVQSDASLRFHDIVTAAGHLYHGRAPGAGTSSYGEVSFHGAGETSDLVSMQQGGTWLDSRAGDWQSRASTLWGGNLRTREHGINPAIPAGMAPYVPDIPATAADERVNSAHVVIAPATPATAPDFPGNEIETQKFASKACLVLDVSAAGNMKLYKYVADNNGAYIRDVGLGPQQYSRRELSVPAGLIVGDTPAIKFYDHRRARWINVVDLDVGVLKSLIETPGQAGGFARGGTSFDPATEWNGIVYVTHRDTTAGAVRLVNGASIPSRPTSANGYTAGFTLATDAPAYILGDYNADGHIASDGDSIRQPDSTSEPPAGIAADAVTILSNGWSDAMSDRSLSNRRAHQTEVAVALLTGLVPTNAGGNGTYSGGVENLPRFLEDWSGVKFGYRGSMVVMYESERATEPWGSSNVYNPPNRIWGFNDLFAQGILPPGTPNSRTYRRIGFRDLSQAEYEGALRQIDRE